MPFVSVNNVARVTLTFTNTGGNQAVNVLHFEDDLEAHNISALGDLVDVIETWANASWAPISAADWSMTRIEARYLETEDDLYIDRTVAIEGTSINDSAPSTVTIAVSLRSNFTGRSRRGRLFHVGLAENSMNGDLIDLTTAANITNAYEALRTSAPIDGWTWIVLSYVSDGAPRVTPLTTPITSILLTDLIVDHMNTRKPRP